MTKILTLLFVLITVSVYSQSIEGLVINEGKDTPVEFVNIGLSGKNIGTVSDESGKFSLFIDSQFDNDSLLFSKIGFQHFQVKVSDFRSMSEKVILLKEKTYDLSEVVIKPIKVREELLGITTKNTSIQAGFKDNLLGYECGVLMKVKKPAFIKRVNLNVANCTYDTVFYRLNIYKVVGSKEFENILTEPIYVEMTKEQIGDQLTLDLRSRNIVVDGDFLVTLEHVKDLGPGTYNFCAALLGKTYFRKTSQGEWGSIPIGISISVVADVER